MEKIFGFVIAIVKNIHCDCSDLVAQLARTKRENLFIEENEAESNVMTAAGQGNESLSTKFGCSFEEDSN